MTFSFDASRRLVSLLPNGEIQSLLVDAVVRADSFIFSDVGDSYPDNVGLSDSSKETVFNRAAPADTKSLDNSTNSDLFYFSSDENNDGNHIVAGNSEPGPQITQDDREGSSAETSRADETANAVYKVHLNTLSGTNDSPELATIPTPALNYVGQLESVQVFTPFAPAETFHYIPHHDPQPSVEENPAAINPISLDSSSSGDLSDAILVNGEGEIVPVFNNSTSNPTGASSGGSGGSAAATSSGAAVASPFVINVIYDTSVNSAPAAFKTAISNVVQYFENQFTDKVTINIAVGYGEVGGYSLGAGALGSSLTYLSSFSYTQIKNALAADSKTTDDTTAVASLPANSPIAGTFWESTAEAKATGLLGANTNIDGYVGFASGNLFDYNNSDGVSAGLYDFFGVVAHEISEVMGRALFVGGKIGTTTNSYDLLDLFHYSSNGVRDFVGSTQGYFSIDGGLTNLNSFNTNAGGDYGDWAATAGNDAFRAFSPSGVTDAVSTTDLRELDVLGWDRGTTLTSPITSPPTTQPDLVVTGFAFTGTSFSYHVSNVGTSAAAASNSGLYYSTSPSGPTTLIGTLATSTLSTGASDTETGKLTFSSFGPSSTTYYVSASADYNNAVAENNETNNQSGKIALVVGNSSNNSLVGTAGNDVLIGLSGKDTVTGNAGADQFLFNTVLNKTSNVDTITDFNSSQGDKIVLDHTTFTALTSGSIGSALSSADFYSSANGAAHLATDHILYNTTNGALSYDTDGTGAAVAVQFAILTNHPALHATDFMLV